MIMILLVIVVNLPISSEGTIFDMPDLIIMYVKPPRAPTLDSKNNILHIFKYDVYGGIF